MATYDYKIETTGEIIEVIQSMHDDPLTKIISPKTGKMEPAKRLISGGTGIIFRGDGWTSNLKNRGYKGKFKKKIRPVGTPVDAPANKSEADKQFQKWVDSGGLDGIEPSIKSGPGAPQTTEQQLDKNYKVG